MTDADNPAPDARRLKMDLRFLPNDIWRRIDSALEVGESREDFIREAVERELQRPERRKRPG